MDEMTRRGFIAAAGASAAVVADDKLVDGGLAEVSGPGIPARETPLVPPGAGGTENFALRCTGCQLCVNLCPSSVLRTPCGTNPVRRPEMAFDRGWCRPECVKCSEVCPAGAVRRITPKEKRTIRTGRAVWCRDRCIAAAEGVNCSACFRHCPSKAIILVPDPKSPGGAKVPVVDANKCTGCGACEHLCPARPLPAMTVEGYRVHREVRPMGKGETVAETEYLILSGKASCVVVKDGTILGFSHDVRTLLAGCGASELRGAVVVDRDGGRFRTRDAAAVLEDTAS